MFAATSTHFYILPNGLGRNRAELFRNALSKNNVCIIDEMRVLPKSVDNFVILIDDTVFDSWNSVLKVVSKKKFYSNSLDGKFKIVKSAWLSECLKRKTCIDTKPYEILKPKHSHSDSNENTRPTASKRVMESNEASAKSKKQKVLDKESDDDFLTDDLSDESNDESFKSANSHIDSDKETDQNETVNVISLSKSGKPSSFTYVCARSSKDQATNHNKDITDKLEELSGIYQSTKDKYRALSYQKAISTIKRLPHRLTTWDEVKALRNVGSRLASHIWEIIQTGEFEKLNGLSTREDLNVIKIFTNVHGIGPTTAQAFYTQGFRTIDDLRSKAKLNGQQKIGLKYYDEFLVRIPRDEAQKIEEKVKEAALSINPALIVQTCGSYRRKKPTCGDVDVLITHPDGHSHKDIFTKLIDLLHKDNFLTDDLVSHEESGNQKKYLGVCQLPGVDMLHRRLDIIIVPYDEFACALLYFTGSAHFNRSMRLLARKMHMSLSEHGLCKNVQRNGTEKLNAGEKLYTPTEESVFKHLNLTYRAPEERDF